MPASFHHVSFTVSDVIAAERFFVELLGFEPVGGGRYDQPYIASQIGFENAQLEIRVLRFPHDREDGRGAILELIQYVHPAGPPADTATNRPGNAHLCLRVDDIEGEVARLRARGVRFVSSPNTVTIGINRGAKAVYFRGPDDIRLELFQPPG